MKPSETFISIQANALKNNGVVLYTAPTIQAVRPKVKRIADNAIQVFRKRLSHDAPYSDIIGVLSGYELISTDKRCGGYCDLETKEIAHVMGGINTVYHEIAHTFQAELGIFDLRDWTLSNALQIEQEAESVARYLFSVLNPNTPSEYPITYFNEGDVRYLRDWFGQWVQNDVLFDEQ